MKETRLGGKYAACSLLSCSSSKPPWVAAALFNKRNRCSASTLVCTQKLMQILKRYRTLQEVRVRQCMYANIPAAMLSVSMSIVDICERHVLDICSRTVQSCPTQLSACAVAEDRSQNSTLWSVPRNRKCFGGIDFEEDFFSFI